MSWIAFVEKQKPTFYFPVESIKNKNIKQIFNEIDIPENKLIFIHTPLFEQMLTDVIKPIEIYPQLCCEKLKEKYGRHPYFLAIRSAQDKDILSICVHSKNNSGYDIPPFYVDFNLCEFRNKTRDDVIDKIKAKLGFLIANESLAYFCEGAEETISENDAIKIIEKAKSNQLVLNFVLTDDALNKIKHRTYILQEIISTEETYVNDLKIIINFWVPKIRAKKMIKEKHIKTIFQDIDSILAAQTYFLSQIKSCGQNYQSSISDCFLEFAPAFRSSELYVSEYPEIDGLLRKYEKKPKFQKRINKYANEVGGRDLHSYMITPVQRMPRYILFLRDILKYTPTSHPDAELLPVAFHVIEQLTKEFDETTEYAQKQHDLVVMQRRIKNGFVFLDKQHQLSRQLPVKISKSNRPIGEGVFYIFTDMILLIQTIKHGTKALYDSPILCFPYFYQWPTLSSITINASGKNYHKSNRVYEIEFSNIEALHQAISEIQILQEKFYSKNPSKHVVKWENVNFSTPLHPLLNPHAVVFHNDIYIISGRHIIFIDSNNNMKHCATLPDEINNSVSASNDKYIFIYAGNSIFRFDPLVNGYQRCKLVGDLPAREGSTMVANNEYLIIFGGKSKKGLKRYSNELIMISLDDYSLTFHKNIPHLPSPRCYHSAFLDSDDIMYIFGGSDGSDLCKNDNQIFSCNISSMLWADLNIFLPPRKHHTLLKTGNYFIVIGGSKSETHIVDISSKTLITDISEFGNFGNICKYSSAVLLNHDIFYFSGSNSEKTPSAQMLKVVIPLVSKVIESSLSQPQDQPQMISHDFTNTNYQTNDIDTDLGQQENTPLCQDQTIDHQTIQKKSSNTKKAMLIIGSVAAILGVTVLLMKNKNTLKRFFSK